MINYILILVLLLVAELIYLRIADRFNIIDKPNECFVRLQQLWKLIKTF